MAYTIDGFWIPRLKQIRRPTTSQLQQGWAVEGEINAWFVEADLLLRSGFQNLSSPIWLVAAPGAVGKSTLAREMSAHTGAVYLDLSTADTVAGNYLTGGLVKSGLYADWQNQTTTVFIDALDEARLRVTQRSFEDFLTDIATSAKNRGLPVLMFGRVGIIEDSWIVLNDSKIECPIFDIDFFDKQKAVRFVMARLDRYARDPHFKALASSLIAHRRNYEQVVTEIIETLEKESASDGAQFFGYAPVLEAVATVLSEVTNPSSVNLSLKTVLGERILRFLVDHILDRESKKLRDQVRNAIPEADTLYTPTEQLARLAGIIYGVQADLILPKLLPSEVATYENAIQTLLPVHPFLDGSGRAPSGAVFGAAINSHALFDASPQVVKAAERHADFGPNTPNPFLIDFYLDHAKKLSGAIPTVRPEHVVALYESIRARAGADDLVSLTIEGDEESEDADVEIGISSVGKDDRYLAFRTSQAGALRFGRQVARVMVDAPGIDVVVGFSNPVEMIAPVSMSVKRFQFDCTELAVVAGRSDADENTVFLEALNPAIGSFSNAPVVRKGVEFLVAWPDATKHPWVQFRHQPEHEDGKEMHNALNRLCRLILAFQSHKRGGLARFKGKVEHARITKGELGIRIRERLIQDRVISYNQEVYFLDPNKLGEVVGATYQDLRLKRFSNRVREYLRGIIDKE